MLKQDTNSKTKNWQKTITSLSLVAVGGIAGASGTYLAQRPEIQAQISPAIAAPLPDSPTRNNFITDVVEKVSPAVVRIDASRTLTSQSPEEPFFREFFGDDAPSSPRQRVEEGTGSGFIISSDGKILTNAHVVAGADRVSVVLKDGRTLQGKVMGTDPLTDVAVIKVEANNLPVVSLGNSEDLKPGEWAIAIGNPLGLDSTVTTGIISGTGRSSNQVGIPDKRVNFIQTDAAINPGNSGGPLLNANGQVIGMNTAIIRRAQGLGFAIPINTAKNIADRLVKNGKVEHAYLGIQMATLTPEVKRQINSDPDLRLKIDEDKGVLVLRVLPNSPAAKGGLKSGDTIIEVNGQPVATSDRLQQSVNNVEVGANLPLTLRRQGQTVQVNIRTGAFPVSRSEN
jgi:Do/DeqQ family serine protease